MKFVLYAALSALIFAQSCKKNDHEPQNPSPGPDNIAFEDNRLSAVIPNQTAPVFLSGTVKDETGNPIQNAEVKAGDTTIHTDKNGFFQFQAAIHFNTKYAVVSVTHAGYFKGTKTFTPSASGKAVHYFEIKLLQQGTAKTVSSAGGNIVLDNKIDLTFPQNGIVTSTGTAYSGDVQVTARYFDPGSANFLETMPGMLTGLNAQNKLQALQSYGMASVELKDIAGNILQIAPGKTVTMKLPAPGDGPATIPLWHFNEKFGIWISAGTATKSGNSYVAEVNHFSTWNLDLEFNSFSLTVQFKDAGGNILSGLKVYAYTQSLHKIAYFFTDQNGNATLINCPSSEPLILKTIFDCDTTINQLALLTADRSETITLNTDPAKIKSFSVHGKLSNCDDSPLPNQPFQLYFSSGSISRAIPAVTDTAGNYSFTASFCNTNSTGTVQAIALVNTTYHYSPVSNITAGNTVYDAKICDTTVGVGDNFVVVFPDYKLDSIIRKIISKPTGDILYGEIKNIDTILTASANISDLRGSEYLTGLQKIEVKISNITDLNPVKNLKKLTALFINSKGGVALSDLSPLQDLFQLTALQINSDAITDLRPISNLTNLGYLTMHSNTVTDLSPLSGLKNINQLEIRGTQISDISVLQNMTKLNILFLSETNVSDLSVFENLPGLHSLSLSNNKIIDITPFKNLIHLESLSLSFNQIVDVTPLKDLTTLLTLSLDHNLLTTIPSFDNLIHLGSIYLQNNKITEISGLQNLTALRLLVLSTNNISDITPLINGVPVLYDLQINTQTPGPLPLVQKNAFVASHPTTTVGWD